MTSSLRNSLHRRNHKERSQLAHRSKYGILEKHGDYVKRARDYHSKQDRLKRLKQKAAERNKDEFYFSMKNEKTKRGVHIKDRGNRALPVDIVKVLKTQDENYVRTMRLANLKKIDKLKSQLMATASLFKSDLLRDETADDHLDEEEREILNDAGVLSGSSQRKSPGSKRKHIVFVENEDEARGYRLPESQPDSKVDAESSLNVEEAEIDLGWTVTKPKTSKRPQSSVQATAEASSEGSEAPIEHRRRILKELSARLARNKQMLYAEREFEMQRLMMGKGGRKKLRGAEKVEGPSDEEDEDEDEIDAHKGKRRSSAHKVDEETYKPRVYKWRLERKR